MDRRRSQRVYSGAVNSEVVIQGDISAQGNINIIIDGARTAYRNIIESPNTFGPLQSTVQDAIKTLQVVSEITSQYLSEGRLKGDPKQELAQLSSECRIHLAELQRMGQEFETMDTLAFRQNDVNGLTRSLEAIGKGLENINGRVSVSVIQLEKSLKRYIAQVKDGERESSIISTVSSSSATTITSQDEWTLIQQELRSVGITAAQLKANREIVVRILCDAFPENDAGENRSVKIKKASHLTRVLSTVSGKSNRLLTAVDRGNILEVHDLLLKGAYIETRDSNGATPLLLAVETDNLTMAKLLLSYKADANRSTNTTLFSPLIIAIENRSNLELIKLLLDHGANANQPDYENMMPLHVAVEKEDIRVINMLLDCGADVNADSHCNPSTALGMAIKQASLEVTEVLIRRGSNVNQPCPTTPVSLAVEKGDSDIIKSLLLNNAVIDVYKTSTYLEYFKMLKWACYQAYWNPQKRQV